MFPFSRRRFLHARTTSDKAADSSADRAGRSGVRTALRAPPVDLMSEPVPGSGDKRRLEAVGQEHCDFVETASR